MLARTLILCLALVVDVGAQTLAPAKWPEVWGDLGVAGYGDGERVAPNGIEFDPLFRIDFDVNVGLLPQKQLYLFFENQFWTQRAAPGITNKNFGDYDFSKRELDSKLGLAWNAFDRVELRTSAFALNNLNRGTSKTTPVGYEDGVELEARYYFPGANIYDTGRLSFVGLGYYPAENLIGGDGSQFRAGMFAQAYVTYSIPSLRAYLYGGAKFVAEENLDPRLVTADAGVALRPLDRLRNLEVRIGDEFTADLEADTSHNLVYGALRAYYGGGISDARSQLPAEMRDVAKSPEIWGDISVSGYAIGERMAANGVEFDPLSNTSLDLNFGLLARKKLYLFLASQFWVQRSSEAGDDPARDPDNDDVSEREFDLEAGLAWNFFQRFELRVGVYAFNNLNRGGSAARAPSETQPTGYQDGVESSLRYYFCDENIYDPARLSFIEIGYFPSQSMIGGGGVGFHPGLFGRAYLSYDLPRLRSYLYGDAKFIAQETASPRLVTFDAGFAARPFRAFNCLELRLGNELTADVKDDTTRNLAYGAVRLNFSTR